QWATDAHTAEEGKPRRSQVATSPSSRNQKTSPQMTLMRLALASARTSLCRGLGSSWFTERFHRNALVTHFQHGQVFCAARQLKDYGVSRCRLHQRAPQR